MLTLDNNFLAILVAAAIHMGVGFFWYSPAGLGKTWLALIGTPEESLEKSGMGKMYGAMCVAALIMAWLLSVFVKLLEARSALEGIVVGFWLWLGFVAPTHLGDYLFLRRPKRLYLLNTGYYLVSLILMGALLAAWQ